MAGYTEFYAQYDEAVRVGANAATRAGLDWVRRMLPYVAVPFIIALAVLGIKNKLSMDSAISYGSRMAVVLWMIVAGAYIPIVQNTIVNDFPNEVANAINGSVDNRMGPVAQFELIDDAAANYVAQTLTVATGISQIGNKIAAWFARGMQKMFLFFTFVVWIIMRQLVYLSLAVLAFMLIFYPFESTREWTHSQFSKVVGIVLWQVSASVMLKIMLGGVQIHLKRISTTGLTLSIDQQVDQCIDIAMFFMGMALMFIMIPATVGVGGAAAASSSVASGAMIAAGSNMARAGNSIQKAGANLNKAARNMIRSNRS